MRNYFYFAEHRYALRSMKNNIQVFLRQRSCIAANGTPFQSYGMSLAIWDHSVTCHLTQANNRTSHLNSSKTGWYSI